MTEDEILTSKEIYSERAGIVEHSGLMTREQAEAQGKLESEQFRMACEVRTVLAMPFSERKTYLFMVGERRGKEAKEALSIGVRDEWMRRKAK